MSTRTLFDEIREVASAYPSSRSAIMPALHLAQARYGWLPPEALREVADALDLTPAYCESIASFYDEVQEIVARYPDPRSASLPALRLAQERHGYLTPDRKYALPPRHELATSMEALIHHFKLVTEGFRVPPGEAYYPIESPRGELGCFVRADGSSKPARVHMRDPSFVNLQAFGEMVRDTYIADLIATLAMLDPILGGIDR